MSFALYSITSSLHNEVAENVREEDFIIAIEDALGEPFEYFGEDFSTYGTHDADIIYVRTGGTEGIFKKLGLQGEIKLLTSGKSNSLAASMEILSYLRANGQSGEILHGTPEYIASRIEGEVSDVLEEVRWTKPLEPMDLAGIKLGVVGAPSDWLISSGVDYAKAKAKLNVELIDIPMSELLDEMKCFEGDTRSFEGSEAIYDSLKRIIERHGLSGLSIRCFDLLDTVHNTGCLALARLNAEGIPSSCEGDIPALLTMVWLQKKYSCPGFQCNLSRISGDKFLFAHCTVPLSMLTSFRYTTHFESGIGTAIKGEMEEREVVICKFAPDLKSMVEIPARILENRSEAGLCRTQIVVEAPGAASYFLHEPLANHHVVAYK